jgi:hypothetical protein
MSRSTVRNELFLNDGTGQKLLIQTGTFVTSAVNVDEHRRLSLTIGIMSATGAIGDVGGFTGTFLVQGTDELAQSNGATGTQEAGNTSRPGKNGFTGALFWTTLPGGTQNITASTTSVLLSFTDVGTSFIRVVFNQGITSPIGSGTIRIFVSGKNT